MTVSLGREQMPISDRALVAGQSNHTPQSNMVNQRVYWGYLQEQCLKGEYIPESPLQQGHLFPKAGTLPLTVYCTGNSTDWRASLPSSLTGLLLSSSYC